MVTGRSSTQVNFARDPDTDFGESIRTRDSISYWKYSVKGFGIVPSISIRQGNRPRSL